MENNGDTDKFKNQVEIFENKNNIMKLKKEKILTLRKRNIKKNNFQRILEEKIKKEQEKYIIYEFEENDFFNASKLYKNNKNDIFKLSFETLKKKNYDDHELKFWLYSMVKVSLKGRKKDIEEKILHYLTNEKVNFLIDILIDYSQFSINNFNNVDQIKNQIKFKYNACSILINLLNDTNKYNDTFIDKIMNIYNFMNILINFYQNTKEISFLILLTHYQWLMNNGIQDDSYKKIIKKHPGINFPQLIQNIFNLNNSELYTNNIRMIIIYLEQQSDTKMFYQYNNYFKNIENIIIYCIQNNNISLLNESYCLLNLLLKSEANCKLIIENKIFIKLLTQIINGFNHISYCSCCLCKLIKNDENNLINENYQIYKVIFEILLNKINSDKNIIKHALKMLRLIINNKNGYNLLNFIINNSYQKFFLRLQEIYFEKPYNLLVQSEIFTFFDNFFDLANNSLKNNLLANGLHTFTLNCLESSYQEFVDENKDNDCYNKLIIKILKLLITILNFAENDLNLKINLKNLCEEKNIYDILIKLNYCKNQQIQDLVGELNDNFFNGYEKEEYSDYENDYENDNE